MKELMVDPSEEKKNFENDYVDYDTVQKTAVRNQFLWKGKPTKYRRTMRLICAMFQKGKA